MKKYGSFRENYMRKYGIGFLTKYKHAPNEAYKCNANRRTKIPDFVKN